MTKLKLIQLNLDSLTIIIYTNEKMSERFPIFDTKLLILFEVLDLESKRKSCNCHVHQWRRVEDWKKKKKKLRCQSINYNGLRLYWCFSYYRFMSVSVCFGQPPTTNTNHKTVITYIIINNHDDIIIIFFFCSRCLSDRSIYNQY